jgi:hypothetical protein
VVVAVDPGSENPDPGHPFFLGLVNPDPG